MRIVDSISPVVRVNEEGRCEIEDIAFVNTSHFTEAARHFQKHGCYTKAHPIVDKREYREFWDREELKRREGMTVPGRLMYDKKNGYYLQKIHITGEHYGYLNYAPIIRTVTTDEIDLKDAVKDVAKARKTGKKDLMFPDFWDGDFYYYNARRLAREMGRHMTVAKARRKGYSYKNAWIATNMYDLIPNRTMIIGAYEKKYLTTGDGTMTMVRKYMDWLNTHTDWHKSRLSNKIDFYKSGFKYEGEQEEHGFKSSIIGVSFMDNPDAAIGKDAEEIFYEEAGKFPNLIESLDVTMPTMEDGDLITGMITIFGTGGTKGGNWVNFEKIFYNPNQFNMMSFENVWDKNARGTGCCFFHPQSLNYIGYMDQEGNSDVEAAKARMKVLKDEQKELAETPEDYIIWCGQRADSPEEAFTKNTAGFFYSADLDQHYKNVKHGVLRDFGRYGEFLGDWGKIGFRETDKHPPIKNFPAKEGDDLYGCYTEFLPLYIDPKTGKPPKDLYRIWHDPYATEKTEDKINIRDSLGAAFLYERPNTYTKTKGDKIVGCLVGRPPLTDDYNDQLFRMADWANAKIMYESDRGEVKPYAKRLGMVDRLVEEPEILWNKEVMGKTGRTHGVSMGAKGGHRILIGAKALKDWLYTLVGKDVDGNPIYNYHYILDLATLEEILSWDLKGNFDRVSALIVGMYDRKEYLYNIEAQATRLERAGVHGTIEEYWDRELFAD